MTAARKSETSIVIYLQQVSSAVEAAKQEALGISIRFAGQEPTSHVTGIYNRLMSAGLPKAGIACEIIPRKEMGGEPVSASVVRRLLQEGRLEEIRPLTPPSTYAYFASPEAAPVLERIRKAGNVAHY